LPSSDSPRGPVIHRRPARRGEADRADAELFSAPARARVEDIGVSKICGYRTDARGKPQKESHNGGSAPGARTVSKEEKRLVGRLDSAVDAGIAVRNERAEGDRCRRHNSRETRVGQTS